MELRQGDGGNRCGRFVVAKRFGRVIIAVPNHAYEVNTPRFRATWSKFTIQATNRSSSREAIRRTIGAVRLETIRHSTVVDWLPVDVHLSIITAVMDVLGIEGARAFWKERLLAAFKTKVMAPFVAGASMVFGEQPYALMKIAMSAYKLMAKSAGEITVTAGADGAVLMSFQDMAPGMARSAGWHALCHGQCEAVLAYLKMEGEIALTDVTASSFHYRMQRT